MRPEAPLHARNRLATAYLGAVGAAGAAILGLSLLGVARAGLGGWGFPAWAALALLTVATGRLSVRLTLPSCIVSVSDAFVVLTVLLLGAGPATVVGALDGFAASVRSRGGWQKRAFNAAGMAISVGIAARLFARVTPAAGLWGSPGRLLAGVLLLAAVQYLVNTVLVSGAAALRDHVSPLQLLRGSFLFAGTCGLAGSLAAALVFLAMQRLGPATSLALLPVPLALHLLYRAALRRPETVSAPSRG